MTGLVTSARLTQPLRPRGELRSGFPYWLGSFRAMLRYDWGRLRPWVGMMVVIQTLMGAGMVLMYGFFYPSITPERALYIATGAPTLALIPLGLVMVPNGVMQDKLQGTFDYVWSLPTRRSAQMLSTFTLYTVELLRDALPGLEILLLERRERSHGSDTGEPSVDVVLWAAAPKR